MSDIISVDPSPEDMVPFNEDYLKELEELAQGRYSADDDDFNKVKNSGSTTPPIMLNQRPHNSGGRGGYNRNRGRREGQDRNYNRGNHYNNRNGRDYGHWDRNDRNYGYQHHGY